jgi:hypothetical protein
VLLLLLLLLFWVLLGPSPAPHTSCCGAVAFDSCLLLLTALLHGTHAVDARGAQVLCCWQGLQRGPVA